MQLLSGSFRRLERGLILVAALVLLPVMFVPVLPIWHMDMHAPQYPEGLKLTIYANTIGGDVDKINTLNHYVGMKFIRPEEFREFRYMPRLLSGFGLFALIVVVFNRRWLAVVGWLAFTVFAGYMFVDFAGWLYDYGHHLDPRAAIKLGAFSPPLIGFKQMANFKVWSLPGPGTWLLTLAWGLGPGILLLERFGARRSPPASKGAHAA